MGRLGSKTIKSFTDLKVWQAGHKLVLGVYKTTKDFSKEEILGLTSQLRRAGGLIKRASRYRD